jgi:hypothetical protein
MNLLQEASQPVAIHDEEVRSSRVTNSRLRHLNAGSRDQVIVMPTQEDFR